MKKFFCILLSFLIFSMSLAISPSALGIEQQSEWIWVDALEDEYYFPKNSSDVIQPISFYSNPDGCYAFRNFLDKNQKIIYDAIIENEGGLLSTTSAITIVFPENYFLVSTDANTVKDEIKLAVAGAMSAAIDDYPEYFWLGGYGVGYNTGTIPGDTLHKYVKSISLSITIDTNSYADWDVIKSCYNQLMTAVNSFEVKGTTRYEKLKSMHDGICQMTTYTLNVPMAHQPTGVFLKGQAVCEGYCEALKLLCDRENIPCIIVVGTGNGGAHAWNYVQMEDGKWYGMDVTWDDQDKSSRIYYDFFLVGSKSYNAAFGKTKFGDGTADTESGGNHVNTGTHFSNIDYALTYPALSEQSYTGVIPMWDSSATFDNTRNLMFIPKGAVASQQILCTHSTYKGNAPSTNVASVATVATTGGTVNITSPVSKTYTIVRHGDVNKDNKVNVDDYNNVRDIAMCKQTAYTDKAQFAASDMNGDGVIDAFDAIYLDLYYNGVIN